MEPKKAQIPCSMCGAYDKSCFEVLNKDELTILGNQKERLIFRKKDVLFKEGKRPLGVFCIRRGKIKVYKRGIDGKEQIVQIAKEGDILGYRALISEELYPVSAQALEDVDACFVTRSDFFEFMNTSHQFMESLLKQACSELGSFTEKLTQQAQRSVRERFAITLYHLYTIYRNSDEQTHAEINLTREDLANLVGTATETLIRLVHDFKEEGIIDSSGRRIQIKQPEKLKSIGHLV